MIRRSYLTLFLAAGCGASTSGTTGETTGAATTSAASAASTTATGSTGAGTTGVSATTGVATTAGGMGSTTATASGSASSGGSTGSTTGHSENLHPLGINLDGVSYYGTELPFLNMLKAGGASSNLAGQTGWYTANDSTWDTAEEAYLQLDSDGYPTSLTASPAPTGGQQFTFLRTLVNYNMGSAAPGATTVYPAGSYRLKFKGQGTVAIGGDASLTLTNSTPDTSVTGTFTVATPGQNAGLTLEIQTITSATDYPRDISIVQSSNAAAYDSGQVFNPAFLAALAPFSSLRFMDWHNTNGEFTALGLSGTAAVGATSATLSAAWTLPSGSYPVIFIDGEQRTATFALGSTSIAWTGGLTNAITSSTFGSQNFYAELYVVTRSWARRALPSNAFWSLADGVPIEVQVALANQLGANGHFTALLTYSDSDIQAMGQLILSGTGMQSGFSPLQNPLTATFELSNEVWNSAFQQYGVAGALGGFLWPTQASGGGDYEWNRNYFGMRVAEMATDLQTAVGTALFDRVIPALGAQVANPYSATDALAAAYWSGGPPSGAPIKAIAVAPYWGGNPSAADCATMVAQSNGGLDDFFATLTSQTGASGKTYASVPTGGWLGQAEGSITGYTAIMSSYPTLHLIAYEGGQNFYATSSGTCSGWPALVTSAERDARMGIAYQGYLADWQTAVGGSAANINNLFNDVGDISVYGAWGLLESTMQSISPLSSAPPKYAAAATYATTP